MSWLKRLFGSGNARPSKTGPSSPDPSARRRPVARDNAAEPFEYVSAGIDAWAAKDFARAEQLLRQGVDAYRRRDPHDVHFALGRLGAFLLEQDRVDEAAEPLEEAIAQGTDIPAIWSDYFEVMARQKDLDGLFDAAMRSVAHVRGAEHPWHELRAHARRADRAGDSAFAEAVASRVAEAATAAGDQEARWAAIGDLGHIVERNGNLERALELWAAAFDEGSNDATTANRLSMHLERARDYANALAVIEEALSRGLPANVEEQLRKRMERCRARVQGRTRADVPAFSIRDGEGTLDLAFQTRVSPPVRALSIQGEIARCFGISKRAGSLVDLSLADGSEVGRHTDLPAFDEIHFAPSGWGLGTERTGRIGDGVTRLAFFSPTGSVVRETEVPDATSQIAFGPDLWYVGCRDGWLYAFRRDGERLWRWETPGAREHQNGTYTRPCPYYVSSDGERATISSMGDIFCVASSGKTLWHFALPSDPASVHAFSIPLAAELSAVEMYGELGLAPGASSVEVKRAYRQRAMETHPDRNPDEPEAAERFRRVHAAYEAIISGRAVETASSALEFSISVIGMDPTVSHLIVTRESVFAGSSDGKLYVLSSLGAIQGIHALGDSWVRPVVDGNGALIAAWCDGIVFYLEDDEPRNLAEFDEVPQGIGAFGDGLYLWHRNRLDVVDRTGHTVWRAEFSKNISAVAAHGDTLVCAAGVVAAFQRAAL